MPLEFERDCVIEGRRPQCQETPESSTKDICVYELHLQAGQRRYRLMTGIKYNCKKCASFTATGSKDQGQ